MELTAVEVGPPRASERILRILCYLTVELDVPGGPAVHAVNVVRGLTEIGCEVFFLGFRPTRGQAPPLPCRHDLLPFFGYGALRSFASRLFGLIRLVRRLRDFRPDCLYARYRPGDPFPAIAAGLTGTPLFLEVNGPIAGGSPGTSFMVRRARGLIFNSPGLREATCGRFGIPRHRSEVVSMHVDARRFRPLDRARCRSRLGLDPRALIAGYVGTFQPSHAIEACLRAIERLAGRGTDARLLLIGGGGDEARYREMALRSPAAARYTFAGWIPHEDLPVWINALDVGVALLAADHAFATEAFTKLKEYLACGIPAVVSECDRRLFRGYPAGSVTFAPADDADRIAGAIRQAAAAGTPGRREERRAFIRDSFSLAAGARKIEAFVAARLGRPRPPAPLSPIEEPR